MPSWDLARKLQQISESNTIGLALLNPQTSWESNWNPDRRFPLGSVAKLLLATAALGMQEGMNE